jgi:multidrug efflux system outer membrane protein
LKRRLKGGLAGRLSACLSACIAAVSLSACFTVGPDYKRPEVLLPTTWPNQMPHPEEVVNTQWWHAFGDPDLDALILEALHQNTDLRVAILRVELFDARLEITNASGKPQASYSANGSREQHSREQPETLNITKDAEYNSFSLGPKVSWEIDLWGQIKREQEKAVAELVGTKASQRGVMLTVVCNVASSYVQLLALDRSLEIAQATLKNRQSTLDVTIAKQKGGSATQITVEHARAELEQARSAIPPIEQQIAITEYSLATLVGRNPGPIKRRTLRDLKMPRIPKVLPADLLEGNPAVMAEEQTLIAANAGIGVAKGDYYPNISVSAALGLQSDDLRYLFAKDARTGSIVRGLTGPLWTAGKLEGNLRQAKSIYQQQVEKFLQSVQTALQDVDTAMVSNLKTTEQTEAISREVQAQQEAVRLTQLRYEGGQSTLLDVLEAQRQVLSAQSAESHGQSQEFVTLVSLYKAIGGGWMEAENQQRVAKDDAAAASAAAAESAQIFERAASAPAYIH